VTNISRIESSYEYAMQLHYCTTKKLISYWNFPDSIGVMSVMIQHLAMF